MLRTEAVAVGVVILSAALATASWALTGAMPSAVRMSTGGYVQHPSTRSWGYFFAFSSPSNQVGDEETGRQIYIFRGLDYACQYGRPDLDADCTDYKQTKKKKPYVQRVTAGLGDPQDPSVNSLGNVVAFDALGVFSKMTGGAAVHRQVYVKDLKAKTTTALTNSPDFDSVRPSLSDAGGTMVFESEAPLLGGRSGVSQVFVYNVATGKLIQITNGAAPSRYPMLNKDGRRVVFESSADLLGDGHDTGMTQIYWADFDFVPFAVSKVYQLTRGNAPSRNAYISEKRPGFIFFESEATNLPGAGGGPGTQIYGASPDAGDVPPPTVFQYTFGPGDCREPAVDPNGFHVAFVCNGDLLHNGTSGDRLFALDIEEPAHVLYQLTGRGGVFGPISASMGLWFVSLATDNDMAGTGICGTQLYLADYNPQHYYEPGHTRVAATALGQVPVEPAPGPSDASCDDANDCTTDHCLGGTTCASSAVPDGSDCGSPGDMCTEDHMCVAGLCEKLGPPNCDDGDPCTDDVCDQDAGGCTHTKLTGFDGLICRLQVLEDGIPDGAVSKRCLKEFARARYRISRASIEAPAPAKKDLESAQFSLRKIINMLLTTKKIPSDARKPLLTQARSLLGEVNAMLKALKKTKQRGGK